MCVTVCKRSYCVAVLCMMPMLCWSGWLAVSLNGSLWVECLTRCEHGGLAVTFLVLLAVSRVTSDFGRPLAVGV